MMSHGQRQTLLHLGTAMVAVRDAACFTHTYKVRSYNTTHVDAMHEHDH